MLASVAFERILSLPLQETDEVRWSPIRLHTFEETSASDTSGLARGAIAKFPLLPPLFPIEVARIAVCVGGLFAWKSVSDPLPLPMPCCCCCCCSAYSKAANSLGHLPWWSLLSGWNNNMNNNDIKMGRMKFNDINYVQLRVGNQIYRFFTGKKLFSRNINYGSR